MRRILIDHARRHLREKRGGTQMVLPLNGALAFSPEHSEDLLRLDEALNRLSKFDLRQGRVCRVAFFGGLNIEETSKFLGCLSDNGKRDWAVTKVWLYGELRPGNGDDAQTVGTR